MKHALYLPPFGELSHPSVVADLAAEAETHGWDGVFVWDHVLRTPGLEVADPWIALAAMAVATERIRLGPMITPLTRRRPHVLARQAVSLDRLSGGRMVQGVGLGVDTNRELSAYGEETDSRIRAARLDEGMALIDELWSGREVRHRGEHFWADGVIHVPTPVQHPRIPVWVGGRGGNVAPVRRAARWDGYFPVDVTPEQLRVSVDQIGEHRGDLDGFDIVVLDGPDGDPDRWTAVGATWCLAFFRPGVTAAEVHRVATGGPPA